MSLELKSISPSRIKTFDMCKFKYFMTYHRQDIKLKTNFGATNGSLIHDILENYSNGTDLDWVPRLYKGYAGLLETTNKAGEPELMDSPLVWAKPKDYAKKKPYCDSCQYADHNNMLCSISREPLTKLSGCPKDLFSSSLSMVEEAIERYEAIWKKILKDEKNNPIGTEYGFNIMIDGTDVPMIGFMDLVLEKTPDTIHVIDYKTGSWTQDYNECRNDIQVRMYSLAARKEFIEDIHNKGYKYKNVILTFDYFTKSPITLAFTKEEDMETERVVREKIKEIQSTSFINRIVKSDKDFEEKWAWKCRSLCDTAVCSKEWKGGFKT